jgi:replicative DNA helicase
MAARTGLDLIVIDYLGLMDLPKGLETDQNNGLGFITKELKNLAKEINTTVLCLAQLNRQCENRPDKRPLESDLRDSGKIEQDADMILMTYRDIKYNPNANPQSAELLIRKFRNGEPKPLELCFHDKYFKFEDWNVNASFRK